jgi:chemotaxis protein MotA
MDPATLIGVALAFAAIFLANALEGGSPTAMFLIPPMILVFGGTFGVALAAGLMKDTIGAIKALKTAFTAKAPQPDAAVAQLVELAEQARRNGLLALEESARSVEDPFLKQGVELLVDGTEPHELREILEAKVDVKRAEDKTHAKLFADMGGFAPTIGIIGTGPVPGPRAGEPGQARAARPHDRRGLPGHAVGRAERELLLAAVRQQAEAAQRARDPPDGDAHRGLMSIQAGSNPRVIEQKLLAFLPPPRPPAVDKQAA